MNAPSPSRGFRWLGLKVAALGLVVLAVVVAAVTGIKSAPASLRLPDGSVLELVRVDVSSNSICSTETGWRAVARRMCPDVFDVALLGAEPVARRRSLHESLMIWLWHRDASGGPVTSGGWSARTEFPDGTVAGGLLSRSGANLYCLELRSAPREGLVVPLVVQASGEDRAWTVPNPRAMSAVPGGVVPGAVGESWPQTNRWPETEIVLVGLNERGGVTPRLRVNALVPPGGPGAEPKVAAASVLPAERAGWVEWRVSLMDEAGNWAAAGWPQRTTRPTFADWPSPARSWRMMAEAMEYVSTGFVTNPGPGSVQRVLLPATGRAHALGVRWLAVLGQGAYRITSAGAEPLPGIATSGQSRTTLQARPAEAGEAGAKAGAGQDGDADGGWGLELRATGPGVLCVLDPGWGGPLPTARLRERFAPGDDRPSGEGRVFAGARVTGAILQVGGRERRAEFIAPVLPGSADRLEVEVVATLPTAIFQVRRPQVR